MIFVHFKNFRHLNFFFCLWLLDSWFFKICMDTNKHVNCINNKWITCIRKHVYNTKTTIHWISTMDILSTSYFYVVDCALFVFCWCYLFTYTLHTDTLFLPVEKCIKFQFTWPFAFANFDVWFMIYDLCIAWKLTLE